jgi:CRISPR-associated protein (TIGR02584 family)
LTSFRLDLRGKPFKNAGVSSEKQQTVLLCLVGTTPAVLTETVFALANEPEPIIPDRVVAVTTGLGREQLKRQLFEVGHWEDLRKTLTKSGANLDGKLLFGPVGDSIRVFPDAKRERELDDIRTLEDNQVVAEYLMELVRSFTENDSIRLVTSLAGGRKTTSALFHSVMTLLGRSQDLITHILVSDPWSTIPAFLFPGCKGDFRDPQTGKKLRSADAELHLAEVPFVPLRYLFKRDLQRSAGSYLQLIQQLRLRTINLEDELSVRVDPGSGEVAINERVVRFSPNEFLFYLLFARRAADGEPPVESFSSIEDNLASLRDEYLKEDNFGHWASRALQGRLDPSEDPRKWAASIRTQLKRAGFDAVQIERLVPRRGHLAIEIPPEHIEIL